MLENNKHYYTDYDFNVAVAEEFGVEQAIIFQNIQHWCDGARARNENFHDGYYWTDNSVGSFSNLFPFWSPDKIGRILNKMVELKMIKRGRYNIDPKDRTYWYTDTLVIALHSREAT